ncbi:MAG: 30S ribosomal protein S20 [Thermoanaerobaculia bacterium]
MANIKSAEKRIRTTAKKTGRNKGVKSKLRHVVKAQRAEHSSASLPKTIAEIDRAAAKGVIHRNTAARYKSRLSKASRKAAAK